MSSPGSFRFPAEHSPLFAELGAVAECLFRFDPASCVLKLRLLAEAITQDIAARLGVQSLRQTQPELLRAVNVGLARAFRVELVVPQRSADEPAAVLLEHLQASASEKLAGGRPRRRAASASI